ncbi:hypothetical protein ACQE3E_07085 [Methylomonas sp. MED-D]|uniref:hypothetical protein n=1 Tax=Methylomonas sp. MED-D TaxID=3418768 RepID=UPI003CFC817B
MSTEARRIELTKKEIVDVNAKFHQKILLESEFYRQLMQAGCVFNRLLKFADIPSVSTPFSEAPGGLEA